MSGAPATTFELDPPDGQGGFAFVQPEVIQGPSWGGLNAPQDASATARAGAGVLTLDGSLGDNSPTGSAHDVAPNSPGAPANRPLALRERPAKTPEQRELAKRRAHQRAYERKVTAQRLADAGIVPKSCPHARVVLRGTCAHGSQRWIAAPCGARECAFCGPRGRDRIAERITEGVRTMWALGYRVTWLVLTFPRDVEKSVGVRHLGHFMRWVRAELRRKGIHDVAGLDGKLRSPVQYAATYENQESGRLHINVLCSPWTYIDQKRMCEEWCREIHWDGYKGASVTVKAVTSNARAMASEMAKTQARQQDPDSGLPVNAHSGSHVGELARYLTKFDQSVTEDRRVSFSRGWPRVEDWEPLREGAIDWERPSQYDVDKFETERKLGEWAKCQSEFSRSSHLPDAEQCACFKWRSPTAEERQARVRRQFAKRLLLYGQRVQTERYLQ